MIKSSLKTTLIALLTLTVAVPAAYAQDFDDEIVSSSNDGFEFNIMGFGDVSYISRDGNNNDGFTIGQGVAHMSAYLGQGLGVFAEVSATGRDSGYSMGATTHQLVTGILRFITAHGCKRLSAGPRW
jgi:hypothetical protein